MAQMARVFPDRRSAPPSSDSLGGRCSHGQPRWGPPGPTNPTQRQRIALPPDALGSRCPGAPPSTPSSTSWGLSLLSSPPVPHHAGVPLLPSPPCPFSAPCTAPSGLPSSAAFSTLALFVTITSGSRTCLSPQTHYAAAPYFHVLPAPDNCQPTFCLYGFFYSGHFIVMGSQMCPLVSGFFHLA